MLLFFLPLLVTLLFIVSFLYTFYNRSFNGLNISVESSIAQIHEFADFVG